MLVADYGAAAATHTFTTSLNLPGDTVTTPEPGVVEDALTKFYTLRVQSLPMAEQTMTTQDTFISSRPPPDAKDPATRIAVSQTGRTALFITLISEYISAGEFAQSPPTAELLEPPKPGQALKIRLTTPDGVQRIVELPPPGSNF